MEDTGGVSIFPFGAQSLEWMLLLRITLALSPNVTKISIVFRLLLSSILIKSKPDPLWHLRASLLAGMPQKSGQL
jgi:hypothetical protein